MPKTTLPFEFAMQFSDTCVDYLALVLLVGREADLCIGGLERESLGALKRFFGRHFAAEGSLVLGG